VGPPTFSSDSKGLTDIETPVNRGLSPLLLRSASLLRIPNTFRHPSCGIKAFVGPLLGPHSWTTLRTPTRKESVPGPLSMRGTSPTVLKHEVTLRFYAIVTTTPSPGSPPPLRASQRGLMGLAEPPHLPACFMSSAFFAAIFASISFCSSFTRVCPVAILPDDICFLSMERFLRASALVFPAILQ